MAQFEFSKARTALKYGIMHLGARNDSIILVPDFICNVVWHPIQRLGLNIKSYPVYDNLSPDWDELERIQALNPAWALLMVHYFGQPKNIDRYRSFCDHHRIKLIEDNAHGHGGKHYGKFLGTLGDIGISSPRKILNESSGGLLFIHSESSEFVNMVSRELPVNVLSVADSFKSLIRRSATVHGWLKSLRGINRDWSDPYLFHESEQADQLINPAASARLRSADWAQIAVRRRAAWQGWQEFCVASGLKPVFDAVDDESCPWAFPVYTKNLTERNRWLEWGVSQGIPLFSWPALPTEVVHANGNSFERWQRMLCFPLEATPKNCKSPNFES